MKVEEIKLVKTCSRCGKQKELTEFHKTKSRHKLGVRHICKKCVGWVNLEKRELRKKGIFYCVNIRNPFTNFSL